jgi:hypothetical protein
MLHIEVRNLDDQLAGIVKQVRRANQPVMLTRNSKPLFSLTAQGDIEELQVPTFLTPLGTFVGAQLLRKDRTAAPAIAFAERWLGVETAAA